MLKRLFLSKIPLSTVTCLGLSIGWVLPLAEVLAAQPQTPEIVFTGADAVPLVNKSAQLGNAVAIYEYVRNNFEFSTYHGSRSGSVNTFGAQRGSDVDIATTMIAMMRSRNIPARYAIATVRMPAAQLTNWLGINNLDVAVQVLKDQGIQKVALATDRSTVDFEHVWSEVFVPFEQYRGLTLPSTVDCSQALYMARCDWIPLDGSFKQKTYNGLNIDPYSALSFDYTGYYNAINNSATDTLQRKDKNPLTILEEQIATWLRTSNPGRTLEDVADVGQIVQVHEGLLPASMPYKVVDTIRYYDSVSAHDEVVKSAPTIESKTWGKHLKISIDVVKNKIKYPAGTGEVLLATLNTKPLTLATEYGSDGVTIAKLLTRLGSVVIATHIDGGKTPNGTVVNTLDPISITLEMNGSPDPSGGDNDQKITAIYSGTFGGYYLIATGGESSNWSQVHRAADQLLADDNKYKVVFNPKDPGSNGQPCDLSSGLNCTPYVDGNNNGWDVSDQTLLASKPALDALTGGLLYVAATQYYAKQREQFDRADHLMKTKTPIIGFLGVVSSVYEAEYIDGTAFSILPGGLLIDMKGITIGGSYRTNKTSLIYSNRQFEFLGHITSSLEHEIWQELTGYDAVSTVRGIQMALAKKEVELLNPKYKGDTADTDTLPSLYPKFGFTPSAPSGFTKTFFNIFSTSPAIWSHAVEGKSFDTFLASIRSSTPTDQKNIVEYTYNGVNSGIYGWVKCVSDNIYVINQYSDTDLIDGNTCGRTVSYRGAKKIFILGLIETEWLNTIIPYDIGQEYFDYFDTKKPGFSTASKVYQSDPPEKGEYDALFMASIRSDIYDRDIKNSWVEYWLPSRLVAGPNNFFAVDIRKQYETSTGRLTSMSFEILNRGGQ